MSNNFRKFLMLLSLGIVWASCSTKQVQWKSADVADEIPAGSELREKYWKLVSINNVPYTNSANREVHVILKKDQSRVIGFSGCNTIDGSYRLNSGSRVAVTTKSSQADCPNVGEEKKVLQLLNATQGYRVNADTLVLYQGAGQVSRWEAVYLK